MTKNNRQRDCRFMQRFSRRAPVGLLLVILCHLSSVAHATPIAVDLDNNGDALLTVDGVTNLQWLDVTATQGLSYDQVEAGFGDSSKIQHGFRYATRQEFEMFSANVGLSFTNGGNFTQNKVPASVIVNLLGYTEEALHPQGSTFFSWGHIDNDNPVFDPFFVSRAFFSFTDRFNTGSSGTGNGLTKDNPNASTGSFLVRATPVSVSAPASFLLLAFGLFCTMLKTGNRTST
ncbi:MAG: hypothetical protein ACJAR0_002024 [Candidatus Azotimanducaceae bacterium]|jgi:hypothetical protein